MAGIEKVCEFSGDYPGWLMYGYKRNSLQVKPEYRKHFKGAHKDHELRIFVKRRIKHSKRWYKDNSSCCIRYYREPIRYTYELYTPDLRNKLKDSKIFDEDDNLIDISDMPLSWHNWGNDFRAITCKLSKLLGIPRSKLNIKYVKQLEDL